MKNSKALYSSIYNALRMGQIVSYKAPKGEVRLKRHRCDYDGKMYIDISHYGSWAVGDSEKELVNDIEHLNIAPATDTITIGYHMTCCNPALGELGSDIGEYKDYTIDEFIKQF